LDDKILILHANDAGEADADISDLIMNGIEIYKFKDI
jgi:hypothetical protein